MKKNTVIALPPDIKQYLENREAEVKYYDEKTGIANPDYEKLTGKKNPLDGYPQSMLPQAYEPKMVNRWVVTLPEWMGIPPYVIFKTQRPSSYLAHKNFLGIDVGNDFVWNDITMEMRDPIGFKITKNLLEIMNRDINVSFSYKLEILDPTGVAIETWAISDCAFTSIDFGQLDYDKNEIITIKTVIKIGDAKLV